MTNELYSACRLCPFECGVDRSVSKGRCGQSAEMRVALAYPHLWEEPCLSGQGIEEPIKGSGAVFFVGCSLGCVYCQNRKISGKNSDAGELITEEELADEFLRLQSLGVHNINLVTAAHFTPSVIKSLEIARAKGLTLPVVYNSSGYESENTIDMLSGYVDVYMPDFKYFSSRMSSLYSGAPDYPEVCRKAIKRMVRQRREPQFDENGFMLSGVIVRHLVLPGSDADSRKIISALYEDFGDSGIVLSLMNQYTPMPDMPYPELNERVSESAYLRVVEKAQDLGFKYIYTQSGESASESFIPEFAGSTRR